MCEAGLPGQLLSTCQVALEDESHPLHPPLQYILERLASQTIEPKELRYYIVLLTDFKVIIPASHILLLSVTLKATNQLRNSVLP